MQMIFEFLKKIKTTSIVNINYFLFLYLEGQFRLKVRSVTYLLLLDAVFRGLSVYLELCSPLGVVLFCAH